MCVPTRLPVMFFKTVLIFILSRRRMEGRHREHRDPSSSSSSSQGAFGFYFPFLAAFKNVGQKPNKTRELPVHKTHTHRRGSNNSNSNSSSSSLYIYPQTTNNERQASCLCPGPANNNAQYAQWFGIKFLNLRVNYIQNGASKLVKITVMMC